MQVSRHDAMAMYGLLRRIGSSTAISSALRQSAMHWACEVQPKMPSDSFRIIASLFRDISVEKSLGLTQRHQANCWATSIEESVKAQSELELDQLSVHAE